MGLVYPYRVSLAPVHLGVKKFGAPTQLSAGCFLIGLAVCLALVGTGPSTDEFRVGLITLIAGMAPGLITTVHNTTVNSEKADLAAGKAEEAKNAALSLSDNVDQVKHAVNGGFTETVRVALAQVLLEMESTGRLIPAPPSPPSDPPNTEEVKPNG